MKEKIYAKFTKERRNEFQMETSIWQEARTRQVQKRALFLVGRTHLKNLYHSYQKLSEKHDFLVPCQMEGEDMLLFSYCVGKSKAECLVELLEKKDVDGFLNEVLAFRLFIQNTALEQGSFQNSKEFKRIFGVSGDMLKKEAAVTWGNIDLTFDNVIESEQGAVIIDYEWVMPFFVPINFILYRALYGFSIKFNGLLNRYMNREELLLRAGISQPEWAVYEEMDASFQHYVYGSQNSYQNILRPYQKTNHTFVDACATINEWVQIYLDKGRGLNEADSVVLPVEVGSQFQQISLPLEGKDKVKAIRFDPAMKASIVEVESIFLTTPKEQIELKELEANTDLVQDHIYVFTKEDPQIICRLKKAKPLVRLDIRYRILQLL